MSGRDSALAPVRAPPGTWRLLAPALIVWALTAAAVMAPGSARVGCGVAGLVGLGCLVAVGVRARRAEIVDAHTGRRARGPGRPQSQAALGAILLLCGCGLFLGARLEIMHHVRGDPVLRAAAASGQECDLRMTLQGYPEITRDEIGERAWVRADLWGGLGPVTVLLWLEEIPPAEWAPGTELRGRGTLDALGAGGPAYGVRVGEVSAVDPADGLPGGWANLGRVRAELRAAAMAIDGAELVPGFAVGDTTLVSPELDRAMRESSLAHLTAVSGANCALVTGMVTWALGWVGAGRRVRVLAAGAGLLGFVALVGPDASVQRAAVMASVLLVSGFGGRRAVALPALALAILVLLAIDPWQSLQPGFALSVAATAGILLTATPVERWVRRRLRLPRWLALPIAVACAAQFACGPLLLLLHPGLPAAGILANVVASPAAPLGTGLGLSAVVLLPVSERLADAALWLASVPARWVATTAELAAGLPLARWAWPDGWPGAIMLALCQAALLLAWGWRSGRMPLGRVRARPRQPWEQRGPLPGAIRWASTVLISVALGAVAVIVIAQPVARTLSTPSRWVVVACDVGQGDALLLRDPEAPEQVVLVDTGNEPELLLACLSRFGVDRIAQLVLTHDDLDHVGALGAIIDRVDAALIAPPVANEEPGPRGVLTQLERAGVPTRIGAAGLAAPTIATPGRGAGGVRWLVLAPEPDARPSDRNAASLVLRAEVAGVRILLLADTGADEHAALLARGVHLGAEVLKVAHHGSRDQDPRIAAAVGAEWALLSVGAENRYGHPADEVLAQLERSGTRALRTDRQGSVALVAGADGTLTPWVERADRAQNGWAPSARVQAHDPSAPTDLAVRNGLG